ncbi:MAG: phosphoribosylformylglycinamidine cyclo-ligase [Bacillota bacterium]|nr:phosphoribosylformylglycinamidine cyclo-ligase [Bacillota bacterium]
MDASSGGPPLTYAAAGVRLDDAEELVRRIAPLARASLRPEVVAGVGGFAGLARLPQGCRRPLLAAGADGVGSKLLVASALGRHETVGVDCVAMNANDVLAVGAEPLFFLDYLAAHRLEPGFVATVVGGVAEGCRQAGCALLGGESAELPDLYKPGEYDLAGFCLGVVEEERRLGPERVREGDRLLALASSGLHANGYALARKALLERGGLRLDRPLPGWPPAPGGSPPPTLGDLLLEPTRIYVRPVLELLRAAGEEVHAAAHVTGGGLAANLRRVLPGGLRAEIERTWPEPPVFRAIREAGEIEEAEMERVFNLGAGFVLVVAAGAAEEAARRLRAAGQEVFPAGRVVRA